MTNDTNDLNFAFSNSYYYDKRLMTFLSPNEPVSSVVWHHMGGFYDCGNSKQNRAEGEAVVDEIIRRIRTYSIGVITFNSIQQTLIDSLLEESLKQDIELENILNQLPEPLFIKNLENVQGDELLRKLWI